VESLEIRNRRGTPPPSSGKGKTRGV